MSAITKQIGKISAVTDHDCGNYIIGEIYEDPEYMVRCYIQENEEFGFEQMRDYALRILETATDEIKRLRKEGVEIRSSARTGSRI